MPARAPAKGRLPPKQRILGSDAFAAVAAIEGLKLGSASKKRLKALQQDTSLTPAQRRAAIRRAYRSLVKKA